MVYTGEGPHTTYKERSSMASELMTNIYEHLDRAALLAELGPRLRGQVYELACPQCGKREAYLYHDGTQITCNRRNKCGYESSLWDYVSRRDGTDGRQTLATLARAAGVELPPPSRRERERATREQAVEMAVRVMQRLLFEEEGRETLSYLRARGWTDEAARAAGFGHYPRQEELRGYIGLVLEGAQDEAFSLFSPRALGETHTLAIPYRDAFGHARGVIVRSVRPDAPGPKYLFNRGVKRGEHFFHIDALPRGARRAVVVEGYIDALMATACGVEGVVAAGGSRITEAQLQEARRLGVGAFVLALDNADLDAAGREGALHAIRLIESAGARAYVARLPAPYKDPDELMRAGPQGVAAFRAAIESPESAASFASRQLMRKHGLTQGALLSKPARDALLDDAMAFAAHLRDPLAPADFFGPIAAGLGVPESLLGAELETRREREAAQARDAAYRALAQRITQYVGEGRAAQVDAMARETLSRIGADGARALRPYTLQHLRLDLMNTPDGLPTGYPALDALVTIPDGAITLVAARPSHGKTTLLTNLFLNQLRAHPGESFAFFSYEETRAALALNMINILAGETLSRAKNKYALKEYFTRFADAAGRPHPALDAAWKAFGEMVDAGRLLLFEESLDAEALAGLIVSMKRRDPRLRAVFIDYMQKIRWAGAQAPTRQVELQRISGRLLDAAKQANIPVVLAAQLGRPAKTSSAREDTRRGVRLDNLRESGDIEQDANVVLGLYNEAVDRAEDADGAPPAQDADQRLTVTVLKNRNGMTGFTVPLRFEPQTLRILPMARERL